MFKKIRELSRGLNSYLKNLGKEPEKQAEEIKEKRKKLKEDLTAGVTFDKFHGKHRVRLYRECVSFCAGFYPNSAQAELAALEFKKQLYKIPKEEFRGRQEDLMALAGIFRKCSRAGNVFLSSEKFMKDREAVDQWDANTPAR